MAFGGERFEQWIHNLRKPKPRPRRNPAPPRE